MWNKLILVIFFNNYIFSTCYHLDTLNLFFKNDKKWVENTINYCSYLFSKNHILGTMNIKNSCLNSKYINSFLYNKVIELRKMRKKLNKFNLKLNNKLVNSIISNKSQVKKINICINIGFDFSTEVLISKKFEHIKNKLNEFWDKIAIYHFNIACNLNFKKSEWIVRNYKSKTDHIILVILDTEETKAILEEYKELMLSFQSLENIFNCIISVKLNYKEIIFKKDHNYLRNFIKFPFFLSWFYDFLNIYEIYELIIKGNKVDILKEIKNRKLEKIIYHDNKKIKSQLNLKKNTDIIYSTSFGNEKKIYNNIVKQLILKKVFKIIFSFLFFITLIIN